MSKLLKVRVAKTGILVIAALFLLSFGVSSLLLQQREDNQTIYFWGNPTPYNGAFLYYGVPTIWYRMFEPYDITQKHLFTVPGITNFLNFFVDLAFWMVIPLIIVYSGKFLQTKRMHLGTTKSKLENMNQAKVVYRLRVRNRMICRK